MAKSILVVSRRGELVSGLRSALNAAGMTGLMLDRAPSAALALRIVTGADKEIDAVILDLAEEDEALSFLAACEPTETTIPVLVAALDGSASSDVEAAAVRYSCRVFRRFEELPAMLAAAAPPPARLILFAPAQEGAGASTAALHIAAALAQDHGLRTLFAELDYHSDSVACRLRLTNSRSLADLERGDDWRSVLTLWNGLHVLAAPTSARILRRRGLPDLATVLENTGADFDIVVGDLPCNTAAAPPHVLSSAERIYVVATAEVTSLHLARRRILELGAVGAKPNGIHLIINRNRPGAVDSEVARQVTGLSPACRLPNDYAPASEAETEGRAVSGTSALGLAYARLAADILGKPAPAAQRREKGWGRLLAWR